MQACALGFLSRGDAGAMRQMSRREGRGGGPDTATGRRLIEPNRGAPRREMPRLRDGGEDSEEKSDK